MPNIFQFLFLITQTFRQHLAPRLEPRRLLGHGLWLLFPRVLEPSD